MRKKLLSIVLVAAFTTTTLAPVTARANELNKTSEANIVQKEQNQRLEITNQVSKVLLKDGITDRNSQKNVELLLVSDGSDITKELEGINAKVYRASTSVYLINITAENAYKLSKINAVKAVGKNEKISLDEPTNNKRISLPDKKTGIQYPDMEYCHELTNLQALWKQGFDGKGMKVAVMDSGVDATTEMFTCTPEGKLKITEYKDFYWTFPGITELGEGDVPLQEIDVKDEVKDGTTKRYAEFEGKKVYLPNDVGLKVLIGYFNEDSYKHEGEDKAHPISADINNNGKFDDKFLIISDKYGNNVYDEGYNDSKTDDDRIFVDTNSNSDLSDDNEMNIYREGAKKLKDKVVFKMNNGKLLLGEDKKPIVNEDCKVQYKKLTSAFKNEQNGKNASDVSYGFVVSDVYKRNINGADGWYVNLGFDANSHGTHVAGEMTGNGYEKLDFVNEKLQADGTIKGAAPGAELMVMKVGQYHGSGYDVHQLAAFEYAAQHGADVINLSMGSSADINDGVNSDGAALIEQLAKKYGTVVSKSAGNSGPCLNSTGGGGSAGVWSFSVGAYNPAWLNYQYPSIPDSLWYFSSNGPTEDGRFKPDFISPGSQISSFPMWHEEEVRNTYDGKPGKRTVGHGLMQGTSQAAPYAGGIMTLLRQAMKELDIPYHPLLLQEAIVNTGDKTINNKAYRQAEIGGGLIQPAAALEYLKNLRAKGLSKEGLKDQDGNYIERNKLYVLSQFNYTEKLEYKPEGLYVRNGDIPSTLKVTLKNDKDVDVNLKLSKDSYSYSNDWLTLPQDNITIPKGTSKVITLSVDKSKLNKDLNCVNIIMDDEKTPYIDGVIPMTIVNYLDLTPNTPEKSEVSINDLSIEQAEKHFVRIPSGATDVKFTVERLDPNEKTNLICFVNDPSGLNNDNYFSVKGNYNSNTYSLPKELIVPGTWEIDVLPYRSSFDNIGEDATKAKNRHKFTTRINGAVVTPGEINLSGNAGEKVSQSIQVSNGASVQVKGFNLIDSDITKNPFMINEYKEIKNEEKQVFNFEITKNDPNYFVNIVTGDTQNHGDDLDILLAKLGSKPGEKATLIGKADSPSANERIYAKSLAPGKYALQVTGFTSAPTTKYKLAVQVVNASSGTIPLTVTKNDQKSQFGIETYDVSLNLPQQVGNLFGYVVVTDASGSQVASSRVNVTVNSKVNNKKVSVYIDKIPSKLVTGKNAEVTVSVENLQKNVSQDVTLMVGLYNKNNQLIKLEKQSYKLIPSEIKQITAGKEITIPSGEGYVVKCFVWDTVDDMNPLYEVINIPASNK